VAWVATQANGQIVYEEQFYASGVTYLVGTIGLLKDSVHRAIVRRIAVTSLGLALHPGEKPAPAKFPQTSTSLEEAAAPLPTTMMSLGSPAVAVSPSHTARAAALSRTAAAAALLAPNGIQSVSWQIAEPSGHFDWPGYLHNVYK
jgi:hypothetical protein